MRKISVVTTTINPFISLVNEYFENFFNSDVDLNNTLCFIIVGDHKTPRFNEDELLVGVEYWSPKAQDEWLKDHFPNKVKLIKDLLIPNNDMRRRNFGYLRAIEFGSDIVITIDDDNFPLKDHSWLDLHIKGLTYYHPKTRSKNRIINPCDYLKLNHEGIYSRGYPLSQYYFNDISNTNGRSTSLLNMGLWSGKPDVDSYTNILNPNLKSEGLNIKHYIALSPHNYFPINTQNTSFRKELSIFHNLYMEPSLIHRYDDIWIGLFIQRLMHKMDHSASFGLPIVEHRRNTHSYIKDFKTEFNGIVLNDHVWNSIMNMPIESRTYKDGFLEIASHLPTLFEDNRWFWAFFNKMKNSMELWVELIEKL